jgi:hypothetical protein
MTLALHLVSRRQSLKGDLPFEKGREAVSIGGLLPADERYGVQDEVPNVE